MNNSDQMEAVETLQKAFLEFSERAEKLSHAYESMQEDFRNLNVELDRKNAELADSLARQEEIGLYLESLLHSMTSGVIGIDNSGIITTFNKAAADILSLDETAVIGRPYSQVLPAAADSAMSSAIAILSSGRDEAAGDKVFWKADGSPVPVTCQSSLLRDHGGRILGAVEVFNDVSKIKALEAEIQDNKTMAALGEMAATVAHEIRNPLGAMGVWAGLLDRDLDKGDPRKNTLNKIVDALSRLNRIVSNLLVYSRPVRAQFRPVPLEEILAEGADYVEIESMRSERNVEVRRGWTDESRTMAVADPEKLSQVVLNLCLNAFQAMPEGGTLSLSCAREGNYATLLIADNGSGISSENLAKVFDPFFTTKENGTGLGLAIVKKFVEHHSGFVNIKSSPGDGTSVQIFLPSAGAA